MHLRLPAAALLAGGLMVLATASPAIAACDAYSGNCIPTPSVSVVPSSADRTPPASQVPTSRESSTEASTLPFTGGELVLLSTVGAGALAAGTALVVAGRRRKTDAV